MFRCHNGVQRGGAHRRWAQWNCIHLCNLPLRHFVFVEKFLWPGAVDKGLPDIFCIDRVDDSSASRLVWSCTPVTLSAENCKLNQIKLKERELSPYYGLPYHLPVLIGSTQKTESLESELLSKSSTVGYLQGWWFAKVHFRYSGFLPG